MLVQRSKSTWCLSMTNKKKCSKCLWCVGRHHFHTAGVKIIFVILFQAPLQFGLVPHAKMLLNMFAVELMQFSARMARERYKEARGWGKKKRRPGSDQNLPFLPRGN